MESNGIAMVSKKKRQEEEEEQWMDIRLPDEMWVEIMWKVGMKALHICKCVSKTWQSYVSHILSCLKGSDLPPLGILYLRLRFLGDPPPPPSKIDDELSYLSLADYNITRWSICDQPKPESATIHMTTDLQHNTNTHGGTGTGTGLLLGNLTIDFGWQLIPNMKQFSTWNMHRGLVIFNTTDPLAFHVYNPATTQNFVLPTPPSLTAPVSAIVCMQAAIINLSDCLLSTHCNFRVIRFPRTRETRWAEIYSSNNNQWCRSELCLNEYTLTAKWRLGGSVFLHDTLFFFTNRGLVVGVKFLSSGEQLSLYSLLLPPPIRNGMKEATLYGSQGCLYLCHRKRTNLWIWKHNGRSLDAQSWIPQLIFQESGMCLCQPIAEKYLRRIVGTNATVEPMIMHPEAPVVFIQMRPSIFAFHLLNDTVDKIVEIRENTVVAKGYVYMYSPCFASFDRLKHPNLPRDIPSPPESAQPNPAASAMENSQT